MNRQPPQRGGRRQGQRDYRVGAPLWGQAGDGDGHQTNNGDGMSGAPLNPRTPFRIAVKAPSKVAYVGSGTKKPLDTNHCPTTARLNAMDAAAAASGSSAVGTMSRRLS
jgi:hypothetical protein